MKSNRKDSFWLIFFSLFFSVIYQHVSFQRRNRERDKEMILNDCRFSSVLGTNILLTLHGLHTPGTARFRAAGSPLSFARCSRCSSLISAGFVSRWWTAVGRSSGDGELSSVWHAVWVSSRLVWSSSSSLSGCVPNMAAMRGSWRSSLLAPCRWGGRGGRRFSSHSDALETLETDVSQAWR